MIIPTIVFTLAQRVMTNSSDVIENISVGRFDNITAQWGGSNASVTTNAPDWGTMLFQLVSVYPDFMYEVAWLLLFALPFVMMWIAHADMTPAAVLGVFFGLYAFMFIGSQYTQVGMLLMVVAFTAVIWSIYQKRG